MIGIDTVDIERLRTLLAKDPSLEGRLFTQAERDHSNLHVDPVQHLAGTLATKEAVIKAASLGSLVSWARRIEIHRDASGAPEARITGGAHPKVNVSISHDGGFAVAVAVVTAPATSGANPAALKPNAQLVRYLRSRH